MRIYVNELYPFAGENGKHLHYIEASGNSTDTQPDGDSVGGAIADGSILVESDTGKVYFYNEASAEWVEQFSFQS